MIVAVQRLVVPVPPSSNRYWRVDKGVTHLSAEARDYRRTVARACAEKRLQCVDDGDVVLRLVWYRAARRGDLDNRLKQFLDAAQGHLWKTDAQISEIRFRRCEDKQNPRLEVLMARDGTPEAEQLLAVRMTGGTR
ncbi:MAG: RusA family crossover junction endodeoxyribonuclease [Deltaproteobacteria bacterium]|nr:RusA family crossover junction endodeoxyribonuclease [Deltaproteobacteria bacterium]